MLTTIKGIYEHGKIILTEQPPIDIKANVIITFLPTSEDGLLKKNKQKIILGMMEGKIDTPNDFNEPLDDLKEYM